MSGSVEPTSATQVPPRDRVCCDCGAKHWQPGPRCAGCSAIYQNEQRRYCGQ